MVRSGAGVFVDVRLASAVHDIIAAGTIRTHVARAHRNLAVSAGDVEHVGRQRQAGETRPQGAHQRLAFGNGGAQVRRAGCQVAVVQIVGLYAHLDEAAHQRLRACRRRR